MMPSGPCACDITQRPRSAAVDTIAPSSSCAKCGCIGSSVGEKKPPDDAILITSAPARITSRTFSRSASTPSAFPAGKPGYGAQSAESAPLGSHGSLWPPVWLSIVTEICIRGPGINPSSTAFLTPASVPPASRTVVIPRRSVVSMFAGAR